MHTHDVHTHRTQLWDSSFDLRGKRGFVRVWKTEPRYFWQLETAERLGHYSESAAALASAMWVRGAGGLGNQDSLKSCLQKTGERSLNGAGVLFSSEADCNKYPVSYPNT